MGRSDLGRDTIAAVATAPGRGGIGVIRVSGPLVRTIAGAVLGRVPEPRLAMLASFRDRSGERIDDGLALYFPAPRSYTGEDVLELQGHGGPVVLAATLRACLEAGARIAEPGEFTRRAFLEGKLDLAQAEAVADLIDAASREAARSAIRSLSGEFSLTVSRIMAGVTELRALVEAMLDFPEEEVEAIHRDEARARLQGLIAALDELIARSRQGRMLANGIHVAIVGRPNVGKSSLLNRLAGEERAIVTPHPGTTRDVVRESLEMDGVPVIVADTAGLRESLDEIEQIGIQRTLRELENADVVLAVSEAPEPAPFRGELPAGAARVEVFNKVDLAPDFHPPAGAVAVSAKSGKGMDDLRQAILKAAGWTTGGESAFLARERHVEALQAARVLLGKAAVEEARWEFFAEELRLAHAELGRITGAVSADDLLGEIFACFCIGK